MKKKQILAILIICSIFAGSKGELVFAESSMDSLRVGETNNVETTSIGSWNASEENLKIEEGKTEYIYIYNNSLELSEEELAECVDTNTDCLNVEICACSIEELLSEENDELEDLINQASNEKNVIWYKITGKSAGTGKIEFIVDEQVITVNITIDQRAVDSSKETEVVSEEIVDQTTENEQNNISEVNHGWSEDGLYYTFEDGTPAKGIVKIEGVSYYFDLETGKLQKQAGWLEIDGKRYFVNDQGKLYVNQFISFGSTRYYMGADGSVQKGIVKANDGKYYHMDETTGKLVRKAGWIEVGDKKYFADDQGKLYVNQFISFGSTRYYMGADGSVQKGIVKANDGKYYHMDETTGKLVRKAGWIEVGDKKYFADDQGKLYVNQFISFGSTRYYMGADGSVQKGIVKANDGKYYHMDETTGKLVRKAGWIEVGDKKYFANDQGKLYVNQFISFGSTRYYMGADGSVQKGIVKANDGKYYHMDETTGKLVRKAGWIEVGDKKYFANDQGKLYSNQFISFGKTYYYCGPDAAIIKGKKYPVNGVLYTFDATGVLQITPGWGEYNGNKYYINPSTGFPYKGWITFGKTAYYANVKGFLVKGWQKIDGYQYYFYPSNYVMARDTTIDGIRIDSSGHAKLRAENYKKGNLCQFLGIDGRKYYNFLKSTHISDKTYIGTKYSKNSYKDGANGFSGWVNSAGAGMDCEGFIDNVLKQCGASHPMSVGGGGKGWVAY